MKPSFARVRDPFVLGVGIAIALIAGGFAAVAMSWRGTARTLRIPLQIPYVVSGALAAIGLIGVGAVLLNVQFERETDAFRRRALDDLIDGAAGSLRAYARRGSTSRVSE